MRSRGRICTMRMLHPTTSLGAVQYCVMHWTSLYFIFFTINKKTCYTVLVQVHPKCPSSLTRWPFIQPNHIGGPLRFCFLELLNFFSLTRFS